ncbi:MAG: FecR domain-containing protein [Deltaproteobacteria bacterium]|nr:FecR domain-containing protein [Deltaproteobacteria bacterium]
MGTADRSSRNLGKHVAQQVDALVSNSVDLASGRARLVDAAASRRSPRLPRILALAAALAVLSVVAFFTLRPKPMTFEIGASSAGGVGSWIAAPPDRDVSVQFSDGSRIGLEPGARARVVELDSRGAHLVLERGSVDANVVHRSSTRWLVSVGPYNVRVTGTRFHATWDPIKEQFTLQMIDGSVVVSGPGVKERPVSNGEALVVQGTDQPPRFLDRNAASSASMGSSEPPLAISALPLAPSASAAHEGMTDAGAPSAPAWNELAASGQHREAVEAAEREGYDSVLASAGEGDLMLLGDAARFSGRAARSIQAYQAVRRRFPGSERAAHAAFLMGKVNADLFRNPGMAARFFDTYLAEQPGGAFAREASGRLIEARRNSGDSAAARNAARRYLRLYPQGPHAALARTVLKEGDDDE